MMMSSLTMVSSRLDDASTTTSSALNSRRRNTKTNLKKKTNKTTTITRCQTSQTASFTPKGAKISGVGKALPKKFITNDDLAKLVETNDEWIRTRTGIGKRHVISGDETLTSLAAEASLGALKMANVNPEDIDLIIVATSSPDDLFGSACLLQSAIGAKGALAYDLTAACSGFVVGLVNVVGADVLSRYVDWRDRGTCILFGDGCGAVVLTATEEVSECSLLGFDMHSDGSQNHHLTAKVCGAKVGKVWESDSEAGERTAYENIGMNGQDVFKFAVRAVPMTIKESLKNANMQPEEIDHLVLHQANQRIIDAAAQRLGLGDDKVVSNIAEYGNTSAASVPLALCEAVESGKVKRGDVVAMAGFGAGLTWASCLLKW
ncbi:unnamed protein product [Bathycoccus prasinos]